MWEPAERAAWRSVKRQRVSDWADRERVLDPMFTAEPGRWRTDRVPYAREWMDSASERHVRRITLMASTQVGKTEAMNNIAGYYIHQDPAPLMLVMPSRETAKLAGERRIMPMVRASPSLAAELTDRQHDTRSREVVFRRCILYFRSAQSPTDLASVPVRVVLGDECDKWPKWTGREAAPLSLAMERTRTFYDHLVVLASTPTTRSGLILQEYEQGDRRQFWVPCVLCSAWQTFQWRNVRWPADIRTGNEMIARREAWYQCATCSGTIDDRAKLRMIEQGEWCPQSIEFDAWRNGGRAADRAQHRSYHIWAAYSPWVPWWKLAATFLDAKDDPARLMNFTNSWLAEVWEERLEAATATMVEACIDAKHAMWEVPEQAVVLTAAVDVQKDGLHFAVVAWGADEEHWLVGVDVVTDWNELGTILFRNEWGTKRLPIRLCCVDSRYRRDEVLDFCRTWTAARMIQGVERDAPIPFVATKLDKHPRTGATIPGSISVWSINVAYFKDLLAHRMTTTADGTALVGRMHLPSDLPQARRHELASEHKVVERKGTKTRARWTIKPGHRRNELLDLMTYCAAAARMVRVDTIRSLDRLTQKQQQAMTPQMAPMRPRPPGKPSSRGPWPRGMG